MNEIAQRMPMMDMPTPAEAEKAVDDARRLFRRTLASWASDVLVLRREGGQAPLWRPAKRPSEWMATRA